MHLYRITCYTYPILKPLTHFLFITFILYNKSKISKKLNPHTIIYVYSYIILKQLFFLKYSKYFYIISIPNNFLEFPYFYLQNPVFIFISINNFQKMQKKLGLLSCFVVKLKYPIKKILNNNQEDSLYFLQPQILTK